MTNLVQLYSPYKMKPLKGRKCYLIDNRGKSYLDLFSGIGVNIFGFGDEDIIYAIEKKIKRYIHLSNYFLDEDCEFVAELLSSRFDTEGGVIFSNSGTEANEVAIKIIKKHSKGKKIIIAFTESFHGRTIGSLSVTGKKGMSDIFKPLLPHIVILPFNDYEYLKDFLKNNGNNVAGMILEFIQGAGGIVEVSDEFVEVLNWGRDCYGFPVIVDEIQSGLGRTGKFFAFQHKKFNPDLITVAKALGGGFPLGALILSKKLKNVLSIGEHGSTFAPNPVSLAASKVILLKLNNECLSEVSSKGEFIFNYLRSNIDEEIQIRGRGLMIGIDVITGAENVKNYCFLNKVLVNVLGDNIIRLLPPYIIEKDQLIKGCDVLIKAIETRNK